MSTQNPEYGAPQRPNGASPAVPPSTEADRVSLDSTKLLAFVGIAGAGILLTLFGLYMPWVKATDGTTELAPSLKDFADTNEANNKGPYMFSLIAIALAVIGIVAFLFASKLRRQLASTAGVAVAVGGVIVIRNFLVNMDISKLISGSSYGIDISRGSGYWFFALGGVALTAGGALMAFLAKR